MNAFSAGCGEDAAGIVDQAVGGEGREVEDAVVEAHAGARRLAGAGAAEDPVGQVGQAEARGGHGAAWCHVAPAGRARHAP